jgi:hypothetical protein
MSKGSKRVSFWHPVSLERLAAEQGVKPVSDLDEVSKLWPVKDDPDELLRFILSERASRRRASERET